MTLKCFYQKRRNYWNFFWISLNIPAWTASTHYLVMLSLFVLVWACMLQVFSSSSACLCFFELVLTCFNLFDLVWTLFDLPDKVPQRPPKIKTPLCTPVIHHFMSVSLASGIVRMRSVLCFLTVYLYIVRGNYSPTLPCGKRFMFPESKKFSIFIQTPSYPKNYGNNQKCSWALIVPPGLQLRINIWKSIFLFSLFIQSKIGVCWDIRYSIFKCFVVCIVTSLKFTGQTISVLKTLTTIKHIVSSLWN